MSTKNLPPNIQMKKLWYCDSCDICTGLTAYRLWRVCAEGIHITLVLGILISFFMRCEQMTADVYKDLEVKSVQKTAMNILKQIYETRLVSPNVALHVFRFLWLTWMKIPSAPADVHGRKLQWVPASVSTCWHCAEALMWLVSIP